MNLYSDLHPKYFYSPYFIIFSISYTSVFYPVLDGLTWIIYKTCKTKPANMPLSICTSLNIFFHSP